MPSKGDQAADIEIILRFIHAFVDRIGAIRVSQVAQNLAVSIDGNDMAV